MKRLLITALAALALVGALAGPVLAANGQTLQITGVTYTKWLWGSMQYDGSMYNFTTVPGEGYGDNGQGSEIELLLQSKISSKVEVNGRIHSRFNQNQWTNFGGFGGSSANNGTGGDRGEFDPRSNQYIKLRGMTVTITPGYSWINRATIGASDWGMYDPWTIGKIRYIDRDNGQGLHFQGSFLEGKLSYDASRISLPRLWAGYIFTTGDYAAMDAAYGLQVKASPIDKLDLVGVFTYVNDIEVNALDTNFDDGQDVSQRMGNKVAGLRATSQPVDWLDVKGSFYYSSIRSNAALTTAAYGIGSFSPMLAGNRDDSSWQITANVSDPADVGLSFNAQYFDIGAEYQSIMAARRESDVLITEGHDATWALPGPSNATYGVFGGNPTRMGYGGWLGTAQQVATINVDNEFMDFDEPLAETVIGWKGFTVLPEYVMGDMKLSGEVSLIDYNTNWQNWGLGAAHDMRSTPYPTMEPGSGFGSFRNAYNPFQERTTSIYVIRADYYLDVAGGFDLRGKFKFIDDEDLRLNKASYLPFNADGSENNANTAAFYTNPDLDSPGQWKSFTDLADDDKQMNYRMFGVGAGHQITDELHMDVDYEYYDVDLVDGNTAFQAYAVHEMASGKHVKNNVIVRANYIIGGAEFGGVYEYSFGEFSPDFGDGYTVQYVNDVPGFVGRNGGFNSLETRELAQTRLKAYMKVLF
jgi:hypothetical protein